MVFRELREPTQGTYGSPNPSLSGNLRFPEPFPSNKEIQVYHLKEGRGSGNRRFPEWVS